jgi:hypothetical protein
MERPPRQGEERGGRRGSPQALTGGVSALRLLHAHLSLASGQRSKNPANCSLDVCLGCEPVQVGLLFGAGAWDSLGPDESFAGSPAGEPGAVRVTRPSL